MKNAIFGLIFWTIAIAFVLGMICIASILSKIVTIEFIKTISWIGLIICIVCIFKSSY